MPVKATLKFAEWKLEDFGPLNNRTALTRADAGFAVYIFASKDHVRPGAIGIHRKFDYQNSAYRAGGNTTSIRFKQYNQTPTPPKEGSSGRDKSRLLPWSRIPWSYIFIAELSHTGEWAHLKVPAIAIAEQMMHAAIASKLPYQGSSCFLCAPDERGIAIEAARDVVKRFENLAPDIFGYLRQ